MSTIETESHTKELTSDDDDRHLLVHLVCRTCGEGVSDSDAAICGYKLSGGPETDDPAECIVCIGLVEPTYPFCPNCGVDWRIDPKGNPDD